MDPGFYYIVVSEGVDPKLAAFMVIGGIVFFASYLVSLIFDK